MKRLAGLFILAEFTVLVLVGCGGGGGGDGVTGEQMGGSIQGAPLSLNGVVTTLAGTAALSGSTDDTGTMARFKIPYGITTDGKSLFVADTFNYTIRGID